MFRVMYADGGMFAKGVTYHELLQKHSLKTPNEQIAHFDEMSLCETSPMPETQDEMKRLLDETVFISNPDAHRQLELIL